MASSQYYEILGVHTDANMIEIKQAYRKLSLKYHPDKYNGPGELYLNINRAYEVLSDPKSRSEYDDSTLVVTEPKYETPIPIVHVLRINLTEIMRPLCVPIEIQRWHKNGNNHYTETEVLYINVQQGVDSNEIIILRKKGNTLDGISGDIKIIICVKNDTPYVRDGLNLIYEKSLTLKEALCGFSFKLEHLSGKVYTVDNTGTDNKVIAEGHRQTIPNMGIVREGGYVGNLIIVFRVIFPEKLPQATVDAIRLLQW